MYSITASSIGKLYAWPVLVWTPATRREPRARINVISQPLSRCFCTVDMHPFWIKILARRTFGRSDIWYWTSSSLSSALSSTSTVPLLGTSHPLSSKFCTLRRAFTTSGYFKRTVSRRAMLIRLTTGELIALDLAYPLNTHHLLLLMFSGPTCRNFPTYKGVNSMVIGLGAPAYPWGQCLDTLYVRLGHICALSLPWVIL